MPSSQELGAAEAEGPGRRGNATVPLGLCTGHRDRPRPSTKSAKGREPCRAAWTLPVYLWAPSWALHIRLFRCPVTDPSYGPVGTENLQGGQVGMCHPCLLVCGHRQALRSPSSYQMEGAAPLRTTQSSETHGLSRGTVPCQPSLVHHVTVSLAQGLPLGIADIRAWLLSVMGHPGRCGVLSSTPALIPSMPGTPAVVTITDVFRQCSLGARLP